MTTNGERLNSKTITAWLPAADIAYLDEIADEHQLTNRDGSTNRNGGLRAIIADHRRLRIKRLARRK